MNTTTLPVAGDLTEDQQADVAVVAEALLAAEGGDLAVHDPATHQTPTQLRRPRVVLKSVTVAEAPDRADLGSHVVIVKAVAYTEGGTTLTLPAVAESQQYGTTVRRGFIGEADHEVRFGGTDELAHGSVAVTGIGVRHGKRVTIPGPIGAQPITYRLRADIA